MGRLREDAMAPEVFEDARRNAIGLRYIIKDLGHSWQLWLYEGDGWLDVGRFYRMHDIEDLLVAKLKPLTRPVMAV